MNDDTVHINGKPATDAQLRKLTGLEGMEDALWQRNNHVTENVARPVEDEWMTDNRSEAEAEWVAHIEA